ncbi:MAG: PfkB family carbohydrate kinase [Bacteroidota bacterium]|nr:PfkB family carbohydrate kinase [Bacteroidota bacterium]
MRALFVGLATIDIIYYSYGFLKEDQKTYADKQVIIPGGMASNAAITFAGLGGNSELWTKIGAKNISDFNQLEEEYNIQLKVRDYAASDFPGLPVVSILINRKNGSRTVLNKPVLHPETEQIESEISNYDVLMIDGFYPDLTIPAARCARQNGIPVVFDSGSWKPGLEHLLQYTDYLIVSKSFRPPGTKSFRSGLDYLADFDFKGMAFTDGSKPVIAFDHRIEFSLNPQTVKCADTLGAGDVLHGAFCHYLAKGKEFREALKSAMNTASFSCSFEGPHTWIKEI